jgi:hypothetical protein
MKLFGKDLFTFKRDPKSMYDFAQHGLLNSNSLDFIPASYIAETIADSAKGKKKKKPEPEPVKLTPKQVYEMKSLNKNEFKIRCDDDYLVEQLREIDSKLNFLGPKPRQKKRNNDQPFMGEWGGVKYGRDELESIRERLSNRRRLGDFSEILEKYPHTSSQKISEVLEANKHLRAQKADTFVPDFPKEAIKAMEEYTAFCMELCEEKPVFYVIADSKDFEQIGKRRDPILLAQSPFGHFWQILGAWDKEMVFLGDL